MVSFRSIYSFMICHFHLGPQSLVLPVFHVMTGWDTLFRGKNKKVWDMYNRYPAATRVLSRWHQHPDSSVLALWKHWKDLLHYCMIRQVTKTVNASRKYRLCRKGRQVDNIPPTAVALYEHCKRFMNQGGGRSVEACLDCTTRGNGHLPRTYEGWLGP